jgi:nicotinamide-nucleotide amidase
MSDGCEPPLPLPLPPPPPLAERLASVLQERGLTVGTAESCTGGLLAGKLTSVAGASAWFGRSYVTYHDDAKMQDLKVPAATLVGGAVSAPVALAMARGLLLRAKEVTLAIAITGVAGPSGGTPDAPVGTVWIGYAVVNTGSTGTSKSKSAAATQCASKAVRTVFPGDREQVRRSAVDAALAGALDFLAENPDLGGVARRVTKQATRVAQQAARVAQQAAVDALREQVRRNDAPDHVARVREAYARVEAVEDAAWASKVRVE